MFIPREFIRTLVDDADIVAIVSERVQLKKAGRRHVGLCPFHTEKTPSFSVNPEKGFYYCFGCGAHGTALDFIVKHNGNDFVAGVETLAAMQGVQIPRAKGEGEQKGPDVGGVLQAALEHFCANLKTNKRAQDYLKSRGVDGKTAAAFKLGYAAGGWNVMLDALKNHGEKTLFAAGLLREKDNTGKYYDYFRDRIIFPVFDRRGRVCGFGARALEKEEAAKYVNSPESRAFSKRFLLYGAHQAAAAAREKGRVLIAEGYMDVVRLAQTGFAESVATMGTAATAGQMSAALRMANTIIFAFDGDKAGRQAAARALEGVLPALKDGDSARFMFLPDGEDPDSFIAKNGADAFEEMISKATPLGDFIEKHLWGDGVADEGKTSAALEAGAKLTRMINPQRAPFWRDLLEKRLSARAGLPAESLRRGAIKKQPRRQVGGKGGYRMPPENKLFNLLCCLSVNPELCVKLESSPPLPGEDITAAEVVAAVLRRLLYRGEDEDENDNGEVESVPAILHGEGFTKLGEQVKSSARRRFAAGVDVAREFEMILANLRREHEKRTGAGKREWLEKIRASSS